jgi:hypothetical protein
MLEKLIVQGLFVVLLFLALIITYSLCKISSFADELLETDNKDTGDEDAKRG